MKLHKRHATVLVAVLAALAVVSYAVAAGGSGKFDESLSGSEEPPYVSTDGNGTFTAELSEDGTSISYRLSYADLEGATTQQAHIHVGQKLVNGGISVFLCTNQGNSPGTQACPQSGTITGTITAANVIGPIGQGIPAGAFAELVQAMKAGVTYVNVHTSMAPGGEIRAQLRDNEGNDD